MLLIKTGYVSNQETLKSEEFVQKKHAQTFSVIVHTATEHGTSWLNLFDVHCAVQIVTVTAAVTGKYSTTWLRGHVLTV